MKANPDRFAGGCRAGDSPERRRLPAAVGLTLACVILSSGRAWGQSNGAPTASAETTKERVERLTAAMAQAQAQIDANQRVLIELQKQLAELQKQMVAEGDPAETSAMSPSAAAALADAVAASKTESKDEIRERLAIDESQIATHEQTKVETESKYPLKVSGMVLFNGFVNTRMVDVPASPAYVIPASGSTGFSMRQTVLGLDARGPHVFGAASQADVRVDFFASSAESNYTAAGLLRLRTAHARLRWRDTEAFVELDKTILSPNSPSSLVAVAQPELAWSGNLWAWNPQIGVSHDFGIGERSRIRTQVGLIDAMDPQFPGATSVVTAGSPTLAELSRWPGMEGRLAFRGGDNGMGPEIGVGGYYSPHRTDDDLRFDAWAGTVDLRLPVTRHFEISGNAYRGQGLGGLGAGGYVDYVYPAYAWGEVAHGLNDVGGWAQLKARATQRIEANAGFGIDNPFAEQIKTSAPPEGSTRYAGLARNRSFYSNVIYSPSAYLLLSLEYRKIWTNYSIGPTYPGDVIGIGAGYRF